MTRTRAQVLADVAAAALLIAFAIGILVISAAGYRECVAATRELAAVVCTEGAP